MPSPPTAGSMRSTPSTSAAATTTPRSDANSTLLASRITSSNAAANPAPLDPRRSPGVALDRRSHQHLAVELRPTPPHHRPQDCHRHAALCLATTVLSPANRQTPHLARRLEPSMALLPAHPFGQAVDGLVSDYWTPAGATFVRVPYEERGFSRTPSFPPTILRLRPNGLHHSASEHAAPHSDEKSSF